MRPSPILEQTVVEASTDQVLEQRVQERSSFQIEASERSEASVDPIMGRLQAWPGTFYFWYVDKLMHIVKDMLLSIAVPALQATHGFGVFARGERLPQHLPCFVFQYRCKVPKLEFVG